MQLPLSYKIILPVGLILAMLFGCSARELQTQNLPQANLPPAYKDTEVAPGIWTSR